MRWRPTKLIKTQADLAGLFPVRPEDQAAVTQSMRTRGFDQYEPLVLWAGYDVVVDGHTRLAAAKEAGLEKVYVVERSFEDLRGAVGYAIARQRDRRNLTAAERLGGPRLLHPAAHRAGKDHQCAG